MRGLNSTFLRDLQGGLLVPLRRRVLADLSLCMELRDNYLDIYYRGGRLLNLRAKRGRYLASFDQNYAKGHGGASSLKLPGASVQGPGDVTAWLETVPRLKLAMDLHFGKHPKEEREAQQLLVRDNNFGRVARGTDYFICDIEYANDHGQFDMVAVHWPSIPTERKRSEGRRLVLAEVKYGDGALEGPAGLSRHIKAVNAFLADAGRVQALKQEMVRVFNQKRALGLVNCGKDLAGFSNERPVLMLVLANHDPDSKVLRRVLGSLPSSPHAELCLATGCLMGYGLFDQAILPLDEAHRRQRECI